MEVLEHGDFFERNNVVKCMCGCKFKYDITDIIIDDTIALTTSPQQYKKYVKCPECEANIIIGTQFKAFKSWGN